MKKRNIDAVNDNKEKQKTYTELNRRRNTAIENNNYVEVIAYDYAMIEDRLLSILKHLNLIKLDITGTYIINPNLRNDVYEFYYDDPKEKHKDPIINNITTKYKIIKKIIKYKGKNKNTIKLKTVFENVEKEISVKECIKNLKTWCDKRNEIIHSMYNKNIDDFDKKIKDIAIEGKNLSYELSNICNLVKFNLKEGD